VNAFRAKGRHDWAAIIEKAMAGLPPKPEQLDGPAIPCVDLEHAMEAEQLYGDGKITAH
jgi:hypothetical protein